MNMNMDMIRSHEMTHCLDGNDVISPLESVTWHHMTSHDITWYHMIKTCRIIPMIIPLSSQYMASFFNRADVHSDSSIPRSPTNPKEYLKHGSFQLVDYMDMKHDTSSYTWDIGHQTSYIRHHTSYMIHDTWNTCHAWHMMQHTNPQNDMSIHSHWPHQHYPHVTIIWLIQCDVPIEYNGCVCHKTTFRFRWTCWWWFHLSSTH